MSIGFPKFARCLRNQCTLEARQYQALCRFLAACLDTAIYIYINYIYTPVCTSNSAYFLLLIKWSVSRDCVVSFWDCKIKQKLIKNRPEELWPLRFRGRFGSYFLSFPFFVEKIFKVLWSNITFSFVFLGGEGVWGAPLLPSPLVPTEWQKSKPIFLYPPILSISVKFSSTESEFVSLWEAQESIPWNRFLSFLNVY
jgi:hypothetical protein